MEELIDINAEEDEISVLEALTNTMRNEILSPELLDPGEELYDVVRSNMEKQKQKIATSTNVVEKAVYELELKRFKYMVNTWKRQRLMKLQKHIFYYIPAPSSNSQSSSLASQSQSQSQSQKHPPPPPGILTKEELEFGTKYRKLVKKHLYEMNHKKVPEVYRRTPAHLRKPPNLDDYVFVRALKEIPNIALNDDGEETLDLQLDAVGVARYAPFQTLLRDGHVELV